MLSWMFPTTHAGTSVPAATMRDAQLAAETATMPLENRLKGLEMACSGLWQLLKDHHGYSDEQLVAAIQKVDMRDGVLDGKAGHHAEETCPNCHRKLLTSRSPNCSWCGAALNRPII